MTTWTFFDEQTGANLGCTFSGPESSLATNTPRGAVAVIGEHVNKALDVEFKSLVDAAPRRSRLDTEMRTIRAHKLALCDWVVSRAYESGQPVPPGWAAYRQALRDVPTQAEFPLVVTWPEVPK